MRLAGTLVLVLCIGGFAGTAYAGNGNGNGNGIGNGGDASPANSANAPGQVKKEEPAAAPTGAAPATAPAPEQSVPAAQGVKPSSDTAKDTHEEAVSDKTKLYGNGRNAGEIAMKNGAGPRTVVHGPGNSQPHKASPCSGGHEVDVHALKAHSRQGSCGGPSPAPAPTPTSEPTSPPSTVAQQSKDPASSKSSAPVAPPVAPVPHDPAGKPAAEAETASGGSQAVLSMTGSPAHGDLPFTGLPLSLAALVGLTLLLSGLAIRKFVVCVESGDEHPDHAGHPRGGTPVAVRSRTGREGR